LCKEELKGRTLPKWELENYHVDNYWGLCPDLRSYPL